ncbi:MAG: ureidoglycolate lyase, partial [Pseudomonadota bacterium]
MIQLIARPLSHKAFVPFGMVIDARDHTPMVINQGHCLRYHDLVPFDVADENGRVAISLFRPACTPKPVRLRIMERHPLGSQAFIPIRTNSAAFCWLIVVAEPGADPTDAGNLQAFVAQSHQGVQYAKGTWHHPLIALEAAQEFLVIDRIGPGNNLQECPLDQPVQIAS